MAVNGLMEKPTEPMPDMRWYTCVVTLYFFMSIAYLEELRNACATPLLRICTTPSDITHFGPNGSTALPRIGIASTKGTAEKCAAESGCATPASRRRSRGDGLVVAHGVANSCFGCHNTQRRSVKRKEKKKYWNQQKERETLQVAQAQKQNASCLLILLFTIRKYESKDH